MTRKIFLYAAFFFIGFAGRAFSFVLPPEFVLREWQEKLQTAKTVRIHQQTTFYDGRSQGTVVTEEIWMKRTGQFRKTATTATGKSDYFFGRERAGKWGAGKFETMPVADLLGPAGILYLFADRQRLSSALRQAGVDIGKSELTLNGRQVQIEIGDVMLGPKVIFAKEENIPVGAELSGKAYKFDFTGAAKFPIRYPSVIEVSSGGMVVEKTEVTRVEINVTIPDSLFETPPLRSGPEKK